MPVLGPTAFQININDVAMMTLVEFSCCFSILLDISACTLFEKITYHIVGG